MNLARSLVESRKADRERAVQLSPIGPAAADALVSARALVALVHEIQAAIEREIIPILKAREDDYLIDAVANDDLVDDLRDAIARIRIEHVALSAQRAALIARAWAGRVTQRQRSRFFGAVDRAIGINLAAVVEDEGLTQVIKLATQSYVGLIRSIPEEYLGRVERLIYGQVIQGRRSAKSMIQSLREIGGISTRRARFIARDQTAKLTTALNRERSVALGIEEYRWRTSKDERVRPTHRAHEGRVYRWDDPPENTGHPGEDYNCRCTASPILKL